MAYIRLPKVKQAMLLFHLLGCVSKLPLTRETRFTLVSLRLSSFCSFQDIGRRAFANGTILRNCFWPHSSWFPFLSCARS